MEKMKKGVITLRYSEQSHVEDCGKSVKWRDVVHALPIAKMIPKIQTKQMKALIFSRMMRYHDFLPKLLHELLCYHFE